MMVPKKSALVLIEFQNEWLAKDGRLRPLMKNQKAFNTSIVQAKQALDHARAIGMPIVHVPLHISDDYKEFGKSVLGLRGIIPKVGTWQGDAKAFHPHFAPLKDEFIIQGRIGASGFAGSNLNEVLRNNGIERLYLMGYATNVCVESTLRDAHDKGFETYVISDAISAFNNQEADFFERSIVHHFGASLNVEDFVQATSVAHQRPSHEVLEAFYLAIGQGKIQKALEWCDESITYIAVKSSSETHPELYGEFKGHEGLRGFLEHLRAYYEIKSFRVEHTASKGEIAFAKGELAYTLRHNGAPYATHWSAMAQIKKGRIVHYRFFKDTAGLESAYEKKAP